MLIHYNCNHYSKYHFDVYHAFVSQILFNVVAF